RVGTEAGARFWGGSRVLDPAGQVVAEGPLWEPGLFVADIDVAAARPPRHELPLIAEAPLGLIERELARLIRDGGVARQQRLLRILFADEGNPCSTFMCTPPPTSHPAWATTGRSCAGTPRPGSLAAYSKAITTPQWDAQPLRARALR